MRKAKVVIKQLEIETDGSPESAQLAVQLLGEFLGPILTTTIAAVPPDSEALTRKEAREHIKGKL